MNIRKIVILSEGVHSPALDQYPSVYKYQSSSEVIREVMACYGEEKNTVPVQLPVKKTTELLGVYSPLGRCLKTSFALTLGQILAKGRAVLYLNFEEYSGFEELMGRSFGHDLSDLMYFVRQGNQNLIHKMNGMIQTVNNLDFIPPVRTPSDIRSIPWEDWENLLQEIIMHSSYETVILDIGAGTAELFSLLEKCQRIYMPVLSDTVSTCKIAQFENLLRIWDLSRKLGKITKVKPPFHMEAALAETYVEQLPCSELGDYVREILRKERE